VIGWTTKPLGELCEVLDRYRKPITKSDRREGPYPYYGAMGIVDYVDGYLFDEPLILLGEDGAKWGSGEPCAFKAAGKYWVNNHAHIMRPDRSQVLDDWLIYYLCGTDLLPFITGLTVPKLNQERMREIPIPVPPLEEQRRIVAVLDEAFAAIATATANAEKNLANARELFEAELDALVEDMRAAFPGNALANHCRRVTVGHVGPMKDRYQGSGIPFLRSQNVRPFQIELDGVAFIDEAFDSELVKSRLAPGDVAVVRTGYPGTAAVIPPSLPISNCADLVIIRPGPDLNPHYVTAFLNSNLGKRMIAGNLVGAAQKHFNVGAAKKVAIPIPPQAEQERFVARVDQLRVLSDELCEVYEEKVLKLTALKQSFLRRAFAGELTAAMPETIAA
jgi:type I restriction enzyme, S subunit